MVLDGCHPYAADESRDRPSRFRGLPASPFRTSSPLQRGEVLKLPTVEQSAERLGVGVRFVRRLIAESRIRVYKVGKHVRIDESDLDAFIAAGRIDPTEKGPRRAPHAGGAQERRPQEHRKEGDLTVKAG